MDQPPQLASANARLACDLLDTEIEIRLRQLGGRWLAVAVFGEEPEVGIGATPRAALAAALATLGDRATTTIMADPQLLGLSIAIRQPA